MPTILIRQRVSDYERWRRAFADQAHARTANGCQSVRILRNLDDPRETIVLLEWDSLVRARLFSQSDDLLDSIEHGDALDWPTIWLLEETPE